MPAQGTEPLLGNGGAVEIARRLNERPRKTTGFHMPAETFSGSVALPIESEALLPAAEGHEHPAGLSARIAVLRAKGSASAVVRGSRKLRWHACGASLHLWGEHGRRGMPDPGAQHRCRTVDGLQTLTTACIDGPAEPDVVVFDQQFIP